MGLLKNPKNFFGTACAGGVQKAYLNGQKVNFVDNLPFAVLQFSRKKPNGERRSISTPYFRIDNDIFFLRLDPYEFQVYAYLVSCAGKKGECWPSTNTKA